MNKQNILIIGQNPECFSGCGNMLAECLKDIDYNEYNICNLLIELTPMELINNPFFVSQTIKKYNSYPIIDTTNTDTWGNQSIIRFLSKYKIDQLIFVGLDIWRYAPIFDKIKDIQNRYKFTWKMIVPYDLDFVDDYWISLMKYPDQVYIYSEFGYNLIKQTLPSVKYFRPKLRYTSLYKPVSPDHKTEIQKFFIPNIRPDSTVFTFIGNNQIRKNLNNTVIGFSKILEDNPNAILFIHTNNEKRIYNLKSLQEQLQIPDYNLLVHTKKIWPHEVALLYNASDFHVLCSLQEGLSYTILESDLCGIPSIISDTTAHKDFINANPNNYIVVQSDESQLLPLMTKNGQEFISVSACSSDNIADGFKKAMQTIDSKNITEQATQWLEKCDNFNDVLDNSDFDSNQELGELI